MRKVLKDLAGQTFGRWIVINRSLKDDRKITYWNCKCECGTLKEVRSQSLLEGKSQSCGCFKDELSRDRLISNPITNQLEKGDASLNSIINSYKQSSKIRNLVWNLSKENVRFLTKQNCYYCDKQPSQIRKAPRCNGEYVYNGIDRINPKLGYEPDNCVPCCDTCNYGKLDMSESEFKNWITRVYNHYLSKEIT